MDTLETGTDEEVVETPSNQSDETVTDDTSNDGSEDADLDLKRIADKQQYLKTLDREIKVLEGRRLKAKTPRSEAVKEDQDDVMTWMTMNTDQLKAVGKEFQEELSFYKTHGIPVTNEIRDRALRDARARKGIGSKTNAEAERQATTSSEPSGEMRKTTTNEIPESIKKLRPDMTLEQYLKFKAEKDAKKKR